MPSADAIPSPKSRDYNSDLYVDRSDKALEVILDWVAGRVSSSAHEPVFCVIQAPPGYGKSWTLAHAAYVLRDDDLGRYSNVYVLGPLQPPEIVDATWLREQQRRFLEKSPYCINLTKFRFSSDAHVTSVIQTMIEDLARHRSEAHLLIIVDELDQAASFEQFEWDVLSPCLELSHQYNVSVLIGVRSEWKFQLPELKRPAEFRSVKLAGFDKSAARNQLVKLTESAQLHFTEGYESTTSIADEILKLAPGYGWTIPALNAEFVLNTVEFSREKQSIDFVRSELDRSILRALRLDSADKANVVFLCRLRQLTHSTYTHGWSVDNLSTKFNISLHDAANFRHHLQSLNLIERHPNGSLGFYRLSQEWNQVFEI